MATSTVSLVQNVDIAAAVKESVGLLDVDLRAPDPYCPIIRQEPLQLTARMVRGKALLKSNSACTTILSLDGHGSAAP